MASVVQRPHGESGTGELLTDMVVPAAVLTEAVGHHDRRSVRAPIGQPGTGVELQAAPTSDLPLLTRYHLVVLPGRPASFRAA